MFEYKITNLSRTPSNFVIFKSYILNYLEGYDSKKTEVVSYMI